MTEKEVETKHNQLFQQDLVYHGHKTHPLTKGHSYA